MTESAALERNLGLYAWHQVAAQTLFWGPIFFLLFSERFPVEQVLVLGATYYAAVVVLEVPSGYFSDRISRVLTLRISNAAMAIAYALFVLGGDSFPAFLSAQIVLALGYAFRSGTDTSFHFDTLSALDREGEFGAREARIKRNAYLAIGASAIVGGGVAIVDLRLAYAIQTVATLVALGIAFALHEPPRHEDGFAHEGFLHQLAECARYAATPYLAWLFAYMVLMTTTAHIPWEFAQPYLAAVFGESIQDVERTPIAAGVLHAMIAFAGAYAAGASIRLRDRIGVGGALLLVTFLQSALIVAMAAVIHPAVAVAMVLRSVQPAVSDVIVSAAIVPRVPQQLRATYQSLHSFAGRLGFAAVLYALSGLGEPGAVADPETMGRMIETGAWLTVGGLAVLVVSAGALREKPAPE
jgi:MFS family permease